MTTSEIKNQLKTGDMLEISTLAGCSAEYVRKILSGSRPPSTPTAQRVLRVAEDIAISNKQIRLRAIGDLINGN